MSDTPETDAFILSHDYSPTGHQWRNFTRKLESERDEWRKAAFEITEQATKSRKELERERDEAREDWEFRRGLYAQLCEAYKVQEEYLETAKRERDEARTAIPAGEWVAYEDHKKVHDAASRLLVAINKELPIGCFTLVSNEYYRLKNAMYWREDAK